MRATSSHLGWILAALNVVALCGLLAARAPEYERLKARDEKFWSTGSFEFSSSSFEVSRRCCPIRQGNDFCGWPLH